jgi:hypothetical protein
MEMRISQEHDQLRTILWIIVVIAVIRLWVMPLWNSFWLDETLTVWAIRDGFWRIFQALPSTPESIMFCSIEWLTSRLGGLNEPTLRLPSLAAAIGALFVYYRIGVEFLGRSAGVTLTALYIALYEVAIEVPNARPYSAALLAESAALLWLLRWVRDGRLRDGILWMSCAVAAGHLHQFFFMVLPLEVGFVVWRVYRRHFVRTRQIVFCALFGIVLSAPAIPQLWFISKQAKTLSWAPQPTLIDFFTVLVPMYVLPLMALLLLLEWFERRKPRWVVSLPSDAAMLGAIVLITPVAIAFALSSFSKVHIFQARWLLPTVPGAILLWGWLLHGIESPFIRQTSLAAGLVASIVITGGLSAIPDYRHEDWRSAVRSIPESGAVIMYNSFPQSRRLESLQVPEAWSYLMAPVLAYRPSVQLADAFIVPFDFDRAGQEYLDRMINIQIRPRNTVTVMTRWSFAGPEWDHWIAARLERAGFRVIRNSAYGRVQVDVYQRPALNASATGPRMNQAAGLLTDRQVAQ